jgi:hypothetical protein
LIALHHFEFFVSPMLQSPGVPFPTGSPMLPDLSNTMYMSTGAKQLAASAPPPLAPLVPPPLVPKPPLLAPPHRTGIDGTSVGS